MLPRINLNVRNICNQLINHNFYSYVSVFLFIKATYDINVLFLVVLEIIKIITNTYYSITVQLYVQYVLSYI